MAATARKQYDHRIRQAIVQARNPDLFPKLSIPDSTRRSWLTRGVAEVVTLDQRDTEFVELHATVAKLEKKVAVLTAVVRLLVTLVRVAGITLGQMRLPAASRGNPSEVRAGGDPSEVRACLSEKRGRARSGRRSGSGDAGESR